MTCDVTYDVLDNERHKAVCELRKLPDGYPSYSAFPFAKWYKDLSLALGIGSSELSCARVRDTLIHLLGGDPVPVTLGDPYGIWKGDGDGMDAGGSDASCGGCDDVVPAGCDDDCAGNPLAEGVAPITTELRAACGSANDMVSYAAIDSHDFDRLCDAIDAVHAQLERDYKVACEVNERQDEQYADMVHKLDRAYEKNRNQRRQLTEVQEALHRRNEGELKVRWQKEVDRLEHENEELRCQLESLVFDSRPMTDDNMAEHGWYRALDADKEPIHIGDVMENIVCPSVHREVTGVGAECFYGWDDGNGRYSQFDVSCYRHHHEPTVEDVLREMLDAWGELPAEETNEAIVAEYAAKLQLREDS